MLLIAVFAIFFVLWCLLLKIIWDDGDWSDTDRVFKRFAPEDTGGFYCGLPQNKVEGDSVGQVVLQRGTAEDSLASLERRTQTRWALAHEARMERARKARERALHQASNTSKAVGR